MNNTLKYNETVNNINVNQFKAILETLNFTGNNTITINGTNDNTTILSMNIEDKKGNNCKVLTETNQINLNGKVSIDYKLLKNYVSTIATQEKAKSEDNLLKLSINKYDQLVIKYLNSSLKVLTKDTHINETEVIPDQCFITSINKTEVSKVLNSLLKFTDTSLSTYMDVIKKVNLKYIDNKITLAAIDGFKVQTYEISGTSIKDTTIDININPLMIKTLSKVLRSLKKVNTLFIGSNNKIAQLRVLGMDKEGNNINIILQSEINKDEKFFDYSFIPNEEYKLKIELDKKELVKFLRLTKSIETDLLVINIVSEKDEGLNSNVELEVKDEANNKLNIGFKITSDYNYNKVYNPSYTKINNSLNVQLPYKIGVNKKFFLTAIESSLNTKKVNIAFTENGLGPINIEGDKLNSYILPINLN